MTVYIYIERPMGGGFGMARLFRATRGFWEQVPGDEALLLFAAARRLSSRKDDVPVIRGLSDAIGAGVREHFPSSPEHPVKVLTDLRRRVIFRVQVPQAALHPAAFMERLPVSVTDQINSGHVVELQLVSRESEAVPKTRPLT